MVFTDFIMVLPYTAVFPMYFCLRTHSWHQKITMDPHILSHINIMCLDDRYPKLNIYISEPILNSYEYVAVAYITIQCMV